MLPTLAETMGALGGSSRVAALLDDGDSRLRAMAADVLGDPGDTAALDALWTALEPEQNAQTASDIKAAIIGLSLAKPLASPRLPRRQPPATAPRARRPLDVAALAGDYHGVYRAAEGPTVKLLIHIEEAAGEGRVEGTISIPLFGTYAFTGQVGSAGVLSGQVTGGPSVVRFTGKFVTDGDEIAGSGEWKSPEWRGTWSATRSSVGVEALRHNAAARSPSQVGDSGEAATYSLFSPADAVLGNVKGVLAGRQKGSLVWTVSGGFPLGAATPVVAYSMKAAEHVVRAGERHFDTMRRKMPEVWHLGGITKPRAVLVDRYSGDVILLGDCGQVGELTLDDMVVALRAHLLVPPQRPAIDFAPAGVAHAEVRKVRFSGDIQNTHFAQVWMDAQGLLERIALGLETPDIVGFSSYADLLAEAGPDRSPADTQAHLGFRLHPTTQWLITKDLVQAVAARTAPFIQVIYVDVGGGPPADAPDLPHQPAEQFARTASELYPRLADTYQEFASFEGVCRLDALAEGLATLQRELDIAYWLQEYQPLTVETPHELPLLRVHRDADGRSISIDVW